MVVKRVMVIQIAPDGTVSLQVKGVPGPECVDFSKFLEEALGEVTDREKTSEYYQDAARTDVPLKRGDG